MPYEGSGSGPRTRPQGILNLNGDTFEAMSPAASMPHGAAHDENSTSSQSNCGEVSNFNEYEEIFMSQFEKNSTQESASSAVAINKKSRGFTDEERAAMRERARELKAEERANRNRAEGESDVLAKIAEMQEPDRVLARRVHEIVKASAPVLSPKTWYGMPAYARDGKIVCFFQCAQKFNTRYATLGFSDMANLDEGAMWPTYFALTELTAAEEARISELVKRAAS